MNEDVDDEDKEENEGEEYEREKINHNYLFYKIIKLSSNLFKR